jgi:tetratricopeptide (TPR) repeat protein
MPPDPLDLPTQTLPQTGPPISVPVPIPVSLPAVGGDATATLAAPVNYDPSKVVAASTRAIVGDYEPISPGDDSNRLGRYTITAAHARGGMGQVSRGSDRELDREIAIKEIQPRYVSDPATLARFLLEAKVTGQLQHPGVVPVYGLGARSDGRPYYAMKFITGESLQDAIDASHKSGRVEENLRPLLRRFIDVCNTIGYAHSRGVLHRDIKPANVMLGEFGETLVVDWGLAKEMGKTAPLEAGNSRPAVPDDFNETAAGFTLFGQTMGTPAYMSPEQAAGAWDVTGVASDVYSLGAILYAILTGHAPYSGPTREVITKVQKGEYRPMTALNARVPKPLQAVCHKALAVKIADRYPNALALAADVERWLADEPVSCLAEPWTVRLARRARRHRTAVASAAALLLTGTVALAIGLVLVNRERDLKKQAFLKAAVARDEAREALLTLTDDVVGEILATSHRPTPQQIRFLDNLVGMYERFAAAEADSPEMRLFTVNALTRIGQIQGRIGRTDRAEAAFAKAAAIVEPSANLADPEWRQAAGELHLFRGIAHLQNASPEAEAELTKAVESFDALVEKSPKPEFRYRQSQALDRLGVWFLVRGQFGQALANGERAGAIRQALAAEFPAHHDYAFRVAQSERQKAAAAFGLGRLDDAKAYAAAAVARLKPLLEASPSQAPYLALMGDVENQLATFTAGSALFEDPNRIVGESATESEAMAHASRAVTAWGRLTTLHPGDATYRRKLAESQLTLAEQSIVAGNGRVALNAIDTAKTLIEELNATAPGNAYTLKLAAKMHQHRALVFRARAHPRADAVIAESIAAIDGIIAQLPDDGDIRSEAVKVRLEATIRARDAALPSESKQAFAAATVRLREAIDRGHADALRDWTGVGVRAFIVGDDGFDDMIKTIRSLNLPEARREFEVACAYGQLARLVERFHPDDGKRMLDHLAFSLDALKKSLAAGWSDWATIDADPALALLRETAEFKMLKR